MKVVARHIFVIFNGAKVEQCGCTKEDSLIPKKYWSDITPPFFISPLVITDATVLFAIFSLSLRLLFRGVSRFTGFPSNPCFLLRNICFFRQYTVLPGVLLTVLRVVRAGGVPVWLGGVCSLVCGVTWECSLTC